MTDIAKLRALHAAATPGKWERHPSAKKWVLLPIPEDADPNNDANAEFCVAAHNEFPALLDQISELENTVSNLIADLQAAALKLAQYRSMSPLMKLANDALATRDAHTKTAEADVERLRGELAGSIERIAVLKGAWEEAAKRADDAIARAKTAEADVERLRAVLEWINLKGGCGLDVHGRITAALSNTTAQPQANEPKDGTV